MKSSQNQLIILRGMAGEGCYNTYQLLRSGKRLFVVLKHLRAALQYCIGQGQVPKSNAIVFVNGQNQARLHSEMSHKLQTQLGHTESFCTATLDHNILPKLPRLGLIPLVTLIWFLGLLFITGKKRYLNLYYLAFFKSVHRMVKSHLSHIDTFVCYNDQPFDIAALVIALHDRRGACRTITIQHGLILSIPFYFPNNTQEFWAWGTLGQDQFKSRHPKGRYVITGRYNEDAIKKAKTFLIPPQNTCSKILIAPSYHHDEIKMLVATVTAQKTANADVFIKLHPATKNLSGLRKWLKNYAQDIQETQGQMTTLANEFDALITLHSTSAVDFLLLGKPVFFANQTWGKPFPSLTYGFCEKDLYTYLSGTFIAPQTKDLERHKFLHKALNI